MNTFEEYFDQIREKIHIDRPELLKRMKQEMHDHAEDAEEYLLLENKEVNSLEHLGSPKCIAEAYDTNLQPSISSLYKHAIIFGIFSLPFSFFFYLAIANSFDSSTNQSNLIYWMIALVFINVMALRKIFWLKSCDAQRKNIIRLFLGFQWILPLVRFVYESYQDLLNESEQNIQTIMTSIGIRFLVLVLTIGMTFLLIRMIEWYSDDEKKRSKFMHWFWYITRLSLFIYIGVTTIWITIQPASFITGTFPQIQQSVESWFLVPWMTFLGLILTLSFFYNIFSSLVLHGLEFILSSWHTPVEIWMPLVILGISISGFCGFLLYTIWRDIRNNYKPLYKQIPWLESAFTLFLLSFFWIGPIGIPNVHWKIPVKNISSIIEQQQLGPWYCLIKNINQNESRYARYEVYAEETGFRIDQQSGPSFFISFSNSDSHSQPIRIRGPQKNNRMFGWTQPIPEGMTCDGETLNPTDFVTHSALQPICKKLTFKNRTLFEQSPEQHWGFSGMTLAPDESSAMIRLTKGVYESEYVFFADLLP